ncbi:DNA (cytosine-5)-methyltransferase 3A isoform d [Oopsacas minuta]|uniref:DNA (cytosine-5-)-methyltransferase n=1 Tax=Oopsacas minuta TaxID=111878 RepID=A0AAV7JXL0_9METZ|nr:DNA (cytosine-5)-methyltransferase 3A isoform d [Oopsacas minuta]
MSDLILPLTPLSDVRRDPEYFVKPLTPSDNQPNPITDILVIHTAETTELPPASTPTESTATVILQAQDPDINNDYHCSDEHVQLPLKRGIDSESDTSNKKLKLQHPRSPPHELLFYNNISGNKMRINSLSYATSPLHHNSRKSFTDYPIEHLNSSSTRKPGRPLGSLNSKSNNHLHLPLAITPTDEHNLKRGPGRPRKISLAHSPISYEANKPKNHRGRGRPRLNANKCRTPSNSTTASVPYEIGSLVWGKIKSCEWWPGMIIAPTVIGKTHTPIGCQWITWHGEYQYSDVLYKNIKHITNFLQLFTPLSAANSNYCEAIFKCINIAKNRTELHKSKLADKQEYDFSVPANFEDLLKDRKDKQREIRTLSSLTQEQQNKLAWALKGFPPYGLAGLATRCEDELSPYDPCIQMIDSGSENDSIEELVVMDMSRYEEGQSYGFPNRNIPQESKTEKDRKNNQMNVELLRQGQIQLQHFCLGCRKNDEDLKEHPLIEGGFCDNCFLEFRACFYLFDENGEQEYCSICAGGDNVVICNNSSCFSFCQSCIQDLISSEEKEAIINRTNWHCFLCQQAESQDNLELNFLKVRPDWNERLHAVFNSTQKKHMFSYRANSIPPPVPAKFRTSIRVLGLFDGISTSMLALKELGFEIDYYIASEINTNAHKVVHLNHMSVKNVGDIKKINLRDIQNWGPFDLVCGGPPSQDISLDNPNRKGLYDQKGTGPLFFEFYRILNYCLPKKGDDRPFFWFFETTASMKQEDRDTISRFLALEPIIINMKDFSALEDCSYFWSNLPGLNRPKVAGHSAKLRLQDCLTKGMGRIAKVEKVKPSAYKGSKSREHIYPVRVRIPESDPEDDNLFINELEEIHSLPKHYTDVANNSIEDRQTLVENSWCVPAIKYILAPLKGYFKSNPPLIAQ